MKKKYRVPEIRKKARHPAKTKAAMVPFGYDVELTGSGIGVGDGLALGGLGSGELELRYDVIGEETAYNGEPEEYTPNPPSRRETTPPPSWVTTTVCVVPGSNPVV
jgi:hypothetical protein